MFDVFITVSAIIGLFIGFYAIGHDSIFVIPCVVRCMRYEKNMSIIGIVVLLVLMFSVFIFVTITAILVSLIFHAIAYTCIGFCTIFRRR